MLGGMRSARFLARVLEDRCEMSKGRAYLVWCIAYANVKVWQLRLDHIS